jgi:Rod binding domain-containing protein
MGIGIPLGILPPAVPDLNQSDTEKQKEIGAAKDFEALLIGQMLRSVREEDSGWLGTGDDEAGATAFGLGEEQLAKAMAAGGGLGLSKVIASGLAARDAARHAEQIAPVQSGNS